MIEYDAGKFQKHMATKPNKMRDLATRKTNACVEIQPGNRSRYPRIKFAQQHAFRVQENVSFVLDRSALKWLFRNLGHLSKYLAFISHEVLASFWIFVLKSTKKSWVVLGLFYRTRPGAQPFMGTGASVVCPNQTMIQTTSPKRRFFYKKWAPEVLAVW